MWAYREAFIGINVAKLKNAIAIADGSRIATERSVLSVKLKASDAGMRRAIQ